MSPLRRARSSSGQSVAPGMTASDHRKNVGHSSSGTPSRSLMTCSGRGTASSATTSTGTPGSMRVHQGPGPPADARLEGPHVARAEPGLDQGPVPGVVGRVGVHHGRRRGVLGSDLEGHDPLRRAEGVRVARHRHHLVVAADHPQPERVVAGHGRLGPQPGVERVGVAGVDGGVEQRVGERRLVDRPAGSGPRRGVVVNVETGHTASLPRRGTRWRGAPPSAPAPGPVSLPEPAVVRQERRGGRRGIRQPRPPPAT